MDDIYIIIVGSPFDGMQFYGTFSSYDEATDYAEANFDGDTWWVALVSPVGPPTE
jgi:hypothetical protein